MTARVIGIFGTGGCARAVMPLARLQYSASRVVFVEDRPLREHVNGTQVVRFDRFVKEQGAEIAIAVAAPAVRADLALKCADAGLRFVDVKAPDLIVMDDVEWGPGCLFSPRVTLTSNIRIGVHFHANLHSYVEHDCRIGDFVTFGPGVRCNGNVTIGDGAYIGCGAMIRQGLTIGARAIVGMGAVVVSDVSAGETVVGNPARPLRA